MVVDADEKSRAAVSALLKRLDVVVYEADHVAQLLDAARKHAPDLVLLDLEADPEGAFTAVDSLKEDPATSDIQVVAMSQRLDAQRTAGATAHAFEDFVSKPVQEKELLPIVRFHLDLPHGLNDAHPL